MSESVATGGRKGDRRAPANGAAADRCVSSPGAGAIDAAEAAAIAARFKVLADPNRLRILSIISSSPAAEVCVCDLPGPLGLRQPTVSHHLKIMVDAGFLRREKRGVWAYYSLVPESLESLAAKLASEAEVR